MLPEPRCPMSGELCGQRRGTEPRRFRNSNTELGEQWAELGEEWAFTVSGRRKTNHWKYWQNQNKKRLYLQPFPLAGGLHRTVFHGSKMCSLEGSVPMGC